jgi:hypothetical protein
VRLPFASPAPYDAWKARDDDYTEYDGAKQATAHAHFRAYVMRQENAHLSEHPEGRDDYSEWHRQWGRRRG